MPGSFNRWLTTIFSFSFLFFSCNTKKKVVFFGDSITTGGCASSEKKRWSTQLATKKEWGEINYGISGASLSDDKVLEHIRKNTPRYGKQYEYVFISYGANDVGYNVAEYTIDKFKTNLREAIKIVNRQNWWPERIVIVSPGYINEEGFRIFKEFSVEPLADSNRLKNYVQAAKEIAGRMGCQFIDIYEPMKARGDSVLFDGLHPNQSGHDLIFNEVLKQLKIAG